jgi:hypothetical protein
MLLLKVLLLKVLLTSSLPIAMLLLLVLLLRIAYLPSPMGSLNPTVLRPLPSNAKSAEILWILKATVNIAKRPSG